MTAPRVTLGDSIRGVLEDEICSGLLSPGTLLDEKLLCARFKVSRTPVREALLQLVSAGHLESVPRRGMVVVGLSVTDLVASLEVLIDMERLAARLAARRMSLDQRSLLQRTSDECREAAGRADHLAYAELDRRFHGLIYAGCGNPVLGSEIRLMQARTRHPSAAGWQMPGRMLASAGEHEQLAAGILAGDEEAVERVMLRHASRGGTVISDSVAQAAARPPAPVSAAAQRLPGPPTAPGRKATVSSPPRKGPAAAPAKKARAAR